SNTLPTFLPKDDKQKAAWMKNFATICSQNAKVLGLSAMEIATISKDAAMYAYLVDLVEIFKSMAKRRMENKELQGLNTPPEIKIPSASTTLAIGIFNRLFQTVEKIKENPNYNEELGQALQII
ncbi:MAG TPA: hypothetical protein VIK89_01265, partial [Cytophagaceae bacterium]